MFAKKIFLICLSLLLATGAGAQTGNTPKELNKKKRMIRRPANCPDFYLTLSTGLNNNTDLIGCSLDVPIKYFVSAEAGVGLGIWGVRGYAGGKYYFKRCQRGLALGGGLTYNNGRQGFQTKLETVDNKKETVGFTLFPQTNFFVAAYYYWGIGKKNNRLFAELGFSFPFAPYTFKQTMGDEINNKSTKEMNFFSPGGPVIGFGYSFGISN